MKMDIKYMEAFGEKNVSKFFDLSTISVMSELPPEMRLMYENINPEASMASFICYCMDKGIPIKYITFRSGFSEDEVIQIVDQAKSVGIYSELCDEFLK